MPGKNAERVLSSESHDKDLELCLKRLQTLPTWKVWEWQPMGKEFLDADKFRRALYLISECLSLQSLWMPAPCPCFSTTEVSISAHNLCSWSLIDTIGNRAQNALQGFPERQAYWQWLKRAPTRLLWSNNTCWERAVPAHVGFPASSKPQQASPWPSRSAKQEHSCCLSWHSPCLSWCYHWTMFGGLLNHY